MSEKTNVKLPFFGIPKIIPYAKKYQKRIISMVTMGIIASLIDSIFPLFNRYAIDHFIGEQTLDTVGIFVVLVVIEAATQGLTTIWGAASALIMVFISQTGMSIGWQILLFLVLNILVPISNFFLRFLFHLAMLPIVAGVSYEVLMGLAHSKGKAACILRWPGMQLQRLTTREPDVSMLECAIVSVNVVLNGIPGHVRKTPEGWAVFTDYRQSEPGYIPPVQEEPIPEPGVTSSEPPVEESSEGEAE